MSRDSQERYVAGQPPDWAYKAQAFRPLVQREPSDVFDLQERIEDLKFEIQETKSRWYAWGIVTGVAACSLVAVLIGYFGS